MPTLKESIHFLSFFIKWQLSLSAFHVWYLIHCMRSKDLLPCWSTQPISCCESAPVSRKRRANSSTGTQECCIIRHNKIWQSHSARASHMDIIMTHLLILHQCLEDDIDLTCKNLTRNKRKPAPNDNEYGRSKSILLTTNQTTKKRT